MSLVPLLMQNLHDSSDEPSHHQLADKKELFQRLLPFYNYLTWVELFPEDIQVILTVVEAAAVMKIPKENDLHELEAVGLVSLETEAPKLKKRVYAIVFFTRMLNDPDTPEMLQIALFAALPNHGIFSEILLNGFNVKFPNSPIEIRSELDFMLVGKDQPCNSLEKFVKWEHFGR